MAQLSTCVTSNILLHGTTVYLCNFKYTTTWCNCLLVNFYSSNAIFTNHLRAPYASISPKIVRFYGARTAPGRRQDIVRCPVKFRYYLKIYSAITAFGKVNLLFMTIPSSNFMAISKAMRKTFTPQ